MSGPPARPSPCCAMDCADDDAREPWEREAEEGAALFDFFDDQGLPEQEGFWTDLEPTAERGELPDVDEEAAPRGVQLPLARGVQLPLEPTASLAPDSPRSPCQKYAKGCAEGAGPSEPWSSAASMWTGSSSSSSASPWTSAGSTRTSAASSEEGLREAAKRVRLWAKTKELPEETSEEDVPLQLHMPPGHVEQFVSKRVWNGMSIAAPPPRPCATELRAKASDVHSVEWPAHRRTTEQAPQAAEVL